MATTALLGACARTSSNTARGPGSTGGGGGSAPANAGGTFASLKSATGFAKIPQKLVDDAKAEAGKLVWYESTPDDQAAKVMAAFRAEYPFVTGASHQVLRGADLAARVAQESQANAETANVVMTDTAALSELGKRNLMAKTDWKGLGVPAELVPDDVLVACSAAIYVIVSNKNSVSETDAPKSWDDLLDPKWKAKLGTWQSPFAIAEMVPAWGGQKTQDYFDKFSAQQPRKFTSTFPLTQAVAAGELPVGLAIFQSAQTTIKQGGPLRFSVLDPTSLTIIYSGIPTKAKHPKTAALFATWLCSEQGAKAYESATDKGNPLLPGLAAGDLVKSRKLSSFPPDKTDELSDWLKKFSK